MPGSGKSTIGKELANSLNYHFIDLDKEIEQKEANVISEIFTTKGEHYFRRIESKLLKEISEKKNDTVIATGGGAPCFYNGIEFMNSLGVTIFINVNTSQLLERVKKQDERPLLKEDAEQAMINLFNSRIHIYKKAQITINTNNLSINESVAKIKKTLKPNS